MAIAINQTTMRKIIVDYQKLNTAVLDLLVETYPDGYDDEDIISYRNAQGEIVDCVRVSSEDTVYLVKVSKRLVMAMEDHGTDEDEDTENEADTMDGDEDLSDDYTTDLEDDPYEDSDEY